MWSESVTQKHLNKHTIQNLLFTIGQFAILSNSHGLLLDVVLREKSWLTSYHLHDGSRNHHLFNSLIRAPGLPLFRRNDLKLTRERNMAWEDQINVVYSQDSTRMTKVCEFDLQNLAQLKCWCINKTSKTMLGLFQGRGNNQLAIPHFQTRTPGSDP